MKTRWEDWDIAMEETGRTAPASSRARSAVARADLIDFDGHRYRATSLRTHPPYDRIGSIPASHLKELGTATRPTGKCTNKSNSGSISPCLVEVASIDGVSPEIAIASLATGKAYLREGAAVPRVLTSAPWVQWRMSS